MDINTPFWEVTGAYHVDEACALESRARTEPWGPEPRKTTYGDVVAGSRGSINWCSTCAVKGNPAAKGLVDPGVGK